MIPKGIDLETFLRLIDGAYDEICIWNRDYEMIYISDACRRHYGFDPEIITGKRVDTLVKEEKLWTPSIVGHTFETGKPCMQRQKTISGIEIITISQPIFNERGEVEYVVQNVRDDQEALFKEVEPVASTVRESRGEGASPPVIYASKSMEQLMDHLSRVAVTKAPILLLGETGVGKSFLARQIHERSDRRDRPFVSINMASLSSSVIEAELFGYEGGAFTGAKKEGHKGLFEAANGGTLFLDEIGDFPLELQGKFLHVLQDERFLPVGASQPVELDVRMIYATNIDLERMIESGTFRLDLYERIKMFPVTVPPLRQRPEDLERLTEYYLEHFNEKYGHRVSLPEQIREAFARYKWQGNVRELSNVIERLVILGEDGPAKMKDLPENFFSVDYFQPTELKRAEDASPQGTDAPAPMPAPSVSREEWEREMVLRTYKDHPSSRKLAAALGVSQSTANRLIRKYLKK